MPATTTATPMITTTDPPRVNANAGAAAISAPMAAAHALEPVALMRVLQLASPSLPVGAYAYSEGLEQAVEAGLVDGPDSARSWILGLLEHSVTRLDVPMLVRMHGALAAGEDERAAQLSARLLAARETSELRATDRDLGQALARVLCDLGVTRAHAWRRARHGSFAALFALACVHFAVPVRTAACALTWSWCENMVAAAIKLIPLGQRAGQRLLFEAGALIPALCDAGLALDEDDIAGGAPGLAVASARHEVQRTRLFRS